MKLFILAICGLFLSCAQSVTYQKVSSKQKVEAKDHVRTIIRNNRAEIKDCFDMSMVNKSAASGQVDLSWLITPKGKATDIKVLLDTIKDDGLMAQCLKKKIAKMDFKKAKTSVEINRYPFIFSVK